MPYERQLGVVFVHCQTCPDLPPKGAKSTPFTLVEKIFLKAQCIGAITDQHIFGLLVMF